MATPFFQKANELKARISAVLFPAQAQSAAEAPEPTPDSALAPLGELRFITLPPHRVPPEGHVYINDRNLLAIDDLDAQQRWTMDVLEPLQAEWMEVYLWIADLRRRTENAMDYREATWGARETKRKKAGMPVSGSAPCLDRSIITERSFQDRIRYDDLLMKRAKSLIEQCMEDWESATRKEYQQMVAMAFKTNSKGLYSRTDLARLRKIESDDPRWQEAMKLTIKAEIVDGSAGYLVQKIRDANGKYHPLPLDIASIRPLPTAAEEASQ